MLQSLRQLFRPDETELHSQDAYIGCATQARNRVFYAELGVPDTLDGRFDMIVLHVWLQLQRYGEHTPMHVKRGLVEAFFNDMDQNLREFGIDMGLKKRIRAMADGYNGRITTYDSVLESGDDAALHAALTRNIYGSSKTPPRPEALAALSRYIREAANQPARAPDDWPAIAPEPAGK